MAGRREPYTAIGIRRVPCARCGQPSTQQWSACANNNLHVGVCTKCDVELNRRVLAFFRLPDRDELMRRYRARLAD